jgi:hypothetical protein
MRLFLLAASMLLAFSFAPAHAAEPAQVTGMYVVKGVCDRLVTPDGDRTAACNKVLILATYSNGRKSYWFSIPKTALISFSGTHETRDARGGTLDLDLVTVATSPNPQGSGGRGSCNFDDPWKGRAHIRCKGSSDAGAFVAEFTTDGQPPREPGGE